MLKKYHELVNLWQCSFQSQLALLVFHFALPLKSLLFPLSSAAVSNLVTLTYKLPQRRNCVLLLTFVFPSLAQAGSDHSEPQDF